MANVRAVVADMQVVRKPTFSEVVSKNKNKSTSKQLQVNLPSIEEKLNADNKLREETVIIGNSLIKDVTSRDGLTTIVSVFGAGTKELRKKYKECYQKM